METISIISLPPLRILIVQMEQKYVENNSIELLCWSVIPATISSKHAQPTKYYSATRITFSPTPIRSRNNLVVFALHHHRHRHQRGSKVCTVHV